MLENMLHSVIRKLLQSAQSRETRPRPSILFICVRYKSEFVLNDFGSNNNKKKVSCDFCAFLCSQNH